MSGRLNPPLYDHEKRYQAMRDAAPELYEALVEAKKELWLVCRSEWNLADFNNFAVVQQINAALNKARGQ